MEDPQLRSSPPRGPQFQSRTSSCALSKQDEVPHLTRRGSPLHTSTWQAGVNSEPSIQRFPGEGPPTTLGPQHPVPFSTLEVAHLLTDTLAQQGLDWSWSEPSHRSSLWYIPHGPNCSLVPEGPGHLPSLPEAQPGTAWELRQGKHPEHLTEAPPHSNSHQRPQEPRPYPGALDSSFLDAPPPTWRRQNYYTPQSSL